VSFVQDFLPVTFVFPDASDIATGAFTAFIHSFTHSFIRFLFPLFRDYTIEHTCYTIWWIEEKKLFIHTYIHTYITVNKYLLYPYIRIPYDLIHIDIVNLQKEKKYRWLCLSCSPAKKRQRLYKERYNEFNIERTQSRSVGFRIIILHFLC
jgi:hypothetical protein